MIESNINRQTFYNQAERKKLENRINRLVLFIFLYSTFSGALRKWMIDSETISNAMLVIQLMLPFSFAVFLPNPNVRSPFSSRVFLTYAISLLILALNPMNLTIFHGIFGIITHLGFWFACFFYIYNHSLFKVRRYLKAIIIICVAEIIFGAFQYTLPETSILNKYANELIIKDIAKASNAVRIAGTFSYLGGFGSFLIFYILLIWGLVRSKFPFFLAIVLHFIGLIACFMSGSRTPTYIFVILSVVVLFIEIGVKKISTLILALSVLSIVSFATIFFLESRLSFVSNLVSDSYENFSSRRSETRATGEEGRRISKTVEDVIFFQGGYPFIGVGLGATYQGTTATWGTSQYVLEHPVWLEEEPQRVIMEGGFFLFFFKILLFFVLYKHLRIPGFGKTVFFFLIFLFLPIVFNTYNATYIFLGLVILDSSYREKLEKNATQ